MAGGKQLKSILKKTYDEVTSSEDHYRDIALYHANIIQQRKKLEIEILNSTETLIDYPLAPKPANASNPSSTDALQFKNLIRYFQRSDYDSLIEERNINDRCGYALCPNKRHRDGNYSGYRLFGTAGKAKDFRIVEKRELEKWCSEDCARRALYVKVQLSDLPSWEGGLTENGTCIDLLVEPTAGDSISRDHSQFLRKNFDEHKREGIIYSPAQERIGDNKSKIVQDCVAIHEKHSINPPQPPRLDQIEGCDITSSHLNLEGYIAKIDLENKVYQHSIEGLD
ncbi:putative duf408 domain protein [Golovinomyces cichoracearum]|uniref:RNA polymerase II subunit B1 CTD phosphatase RPAP2 homolog n=1 Tax=Golovinomyces cichoracearum TaxID=62708 RepID=A0A420IGB6_9PEZI|nr:putative duf408 domain protein [Golovinomyces cichoracearum]